mgnify:CR=1 FL=1
MNLTIGRASAFGKDNEPDPVEFFEQAKDEADRFAASVSPIYGNRADAMLGKEGHEGIGKEIVLGSGDIKIVPVALRDCGGDGGGVDMRRVIRDDDELWVLLVELVEGGAFYSELDIGFENEVAKVYGPEKADDSRGPVDIAGEERQVAQVNRELRPLLVLVGPVSQGDPIARIT